MPTHYYEQYEELKELCLLLPEAERQKMQLLHFKKGDLLTTIGDVPDSLLIIVEGVCSVERYSYLNCKQPHPAYGHMDSVGLYPIINHTPRVGTVRAITACTALSIDQTTVSKWIQEYPNFILKIAMRAIQQLYRQFDLLEECTKRPTYYGVISVLVNTWELYNRTNPQKKIPTRLDFNRQYIADITGKDIRSVNRIVEELKKQNVISIQKGKLYMGQDQYDQLVHIKEKFMDKY